MNGSIFRISLMKSKAYSEQGVSISLRSCTIFLCLSFTERVVLAIFNFSSFSLYSQFSNVGLKKWQSLYQFFISCLDWYLLFTNTELISLSMANQFFVKSEYRNLRNGMVSRTAPKANLLSLLSALLYKVCIVLQANSCAEISHSICSLSLVMISGFTRQICVADFIPLRNLPQICMQSVSMSSMVYSEL